MSDRTPPKPPAVPKGKPAASAPAASNPALASAEASAKAVAKAAKSESLPPVSAVNSLSNGADTWTAPAGATREQLGKCIQGTWRGRVDGKLTVVKHACPLLGLPGAVKKGLAASKMQVVDMAPPPPVETVVVDDDDENGE